jgi:hypothetical protein
MAAYIEDTIENCPLYQAPVIVGNVAVDREGFPVEGANPPVFRNTRTPFTIEFSNEVPADIYLSSSDFFEIESDAWEFTDVFTGRSPLRNLGRYYLFPIDDYYCRDFIIDAAFKDGKLFLQRHPDDVISHQTEGYGIVFERAMTSGGHPGAHAFYQYITYNIGKHSLMVRCEIDCVKEAGSDKTVSLTTKKIKRKKQGNGYYPLASANYYQEQWLQMVLTGTSTLQVGTRDEGQRDTGVASIQQVQQFSLKQLAELGHMDEANQRRVFEGLLKTLSWIKANFSKTERENSASYCAPSGMLQAQIRFDKSSGEKRMAFQILKPSEHIEFISEAIAAEGF